jgi:hypothetical protein
MPLRSGRGNLFFGRGLIRTQERTIEDYRPPGLGITSVQEMARSDWQIYFTLNPYPDP